MKKKLNVCLRTFSLVLLLCVVLITTVIAGDYRRNTPPSPVGVKLVNNAKGVIVTWDKQSDIDGYRIYRREADKRTVELAEIKSATKNTYIDKTAESGLKYSYSVSAYSGKYESKTAEPKVIMHLSLPQIHSIRNGYDGVTVSWSSVKGAKAYNVYRMDGTKPVLLATVKADAPCEYTDKDTLTGKKYTYTVIAVDGRFKSAYQYKTSEKFVAAPQLKSTVNGNGYITVSWGPVFNSDTYRVYRKTAKTDWELLTTVKADVLSVNDKSVKNGASYTYTVEAAKGVTVSGKNEKGIAGKYVSTPQNISLSNYNNGMQIKWNAVSGVKQYRVYRKDDVNTSWQMIGTAVKNSFNDNTIENGVNYKYTVKAVGKNGGVSAHLSGKSLVALKAPTVTLFSMPDRVLLNWSQMSSATGYRVYRKLPTDNGWTRISTIKGSGVTYFEDTGVKNGTQYLYTVRQIKDKVSGSYNMNGFAVKYIAAPTLKSMLSPKGVLLQWTPSKVGTGYIVDRYVDTTNSWQPISTINGVSNVAYQDTGATYGTTNHYRVRIMGANALTNSTAIYAIDPSKPVVALTYDDGPHPSVTHDILDVLEKYNAKATFFVVGSRVNEYKDCIVREARLGCEIGNHTYSHTILTSASDSTINSQIESTNDTVEKLTGIRPAIVRPPGGSTSSRVKSVVNYPLVNWSVDTLDWKNRNSSSVVSSVKNNVRDGSIVLMHDLYGSTAEATETIVPWLINEGYQLVTVTQLMQLKGIYMEPGKLYFAGY